MIHLRADRRLATGGPPFVFVFFVRGSVWLFTLATCGVAIDAIAIERPASDAASLAAAIAAAQPGDEIVLRSGVWRDTEIRFEGTGTADLPITLRAAEPGRTVLTGQSSLLIGGDHLVVRGLLFTLGWLEESDHVIQFRRSSHVARDCRVTACAIVTYNPPRKDRRYFWVSLYGQRNRVDHCYFSGMNHDGVTLVVWHDGTVNDHRIDHNHFARHRSGGGANGWETIRVGTSELSLANSRTTVEANLFEECDGEIETISNKSCENVYRANTFLRTRGMLTLRHGRRCVVDGNFFLGRDRSETGGIRVIGEDHVVINNYIEATTGRDGAAITIYAGESSPELSGYYPAHRALIAFNTIVDVSAPALEIARGLGSSDRTVVPADVVIANNLLHAGTKPNGTFITGSERAPGTVSWTGNIAFGRALGTPSSDGLRELDPRLARAVDNLWRPLTDSPAIDAAAGVFTAVSSDMDGDPRSTLKDVGADEVSMATPVSRPLAPGDVGPEWLGADRVLNLGHMTNASLRGWSGGEHGPLIAGFVSIAPSSLLLRAAGPSLSSLGVTDAATDPQLILHRETLEVARNDDWSHAADAALERGAFLFPTGSRDAALLHEDGPGSFTILSDASDNRAGTTLLEIYAKPDAAGTLVNVAGRGHIGDADSPLVLGFVIAGDVGRAVLIRAVGPTLTHFGVGGFLSRPRLRLFHGAALVQENSSWESAEDPALLSDAATICGAFSLDIASRDSALLTEVIPGAYTVVVSGEESSVGAVLAEVYLLPENR